MEIGELVDFLEMVTPYLEQVADKNELAKIDSQTTLIGALALSVDLMPEPQKGEAVYYLKRFVAALR